MLTVVVDCVFWVEGSGVPPVKIPMPLPWDLYLRMLPKEGRRVLVCTMPAQRGIAA